MHTQWVRPKIQWKVILEMWKIIFLNLFLFFKRLIFSKIDPDLYEGDMRFGSSNLKTLLINVNKWTNGIVYYTIDNTYSMIISKFIVFLVLSGCLIFPLPLFNFFESFKSQELLFIFLILIICK